VLEGNISCAYKWNSRVGVITARADSMLRLNAAFSRWEMVNLPSQPRIKAPNAA